MRVAGAIFTIGHGRREAPEIVGGGGGGGGGGAGGGGGGERGGGWGGGGEEGGGGGERGGWVAVIELLEGGQSRALLGGGESRWRIRPPRSERSALPLRKPANQGSFKRSDSLNIVRAHTGSQTLLSE